MKLSNFSVRLSRNSWHRRLQEYTFGKNVPLFPNLCPYFWLTIACLFIAPVKMTGTGARHSALFVFNYGMKGPSLWAITILVAVLNVVATWAYQTNRNISRYKWSPTGVATRVSRSRFAKSVVNMTDEALISSLEYLGNVLDNFCVRVEGDWSNEYYSGWVDARTIWKLTPEQWDQLEHKVYEVLEQNRDHKEYNKMLDTWNRVSACRMITPDWEERQARLVAVRKAYQERKCQAARAREEAEARREAAARAFRDRMLRVADIAQKVFKVVATTFVVGTAAAIAVVGCYKMYILFSSGMFYRFIQEVFGFISAYSAEIQVGVGGIGIAACLVYIVRGCVGSVAFQNAVVQFFQTTGRGLLIFAHPFGKIGARIASALSLFVLYIKAVKEKQCPRIDWQE